MARQDERRWFFVTNRRAFSFHEIPGRTSCRNPVDDSASETTDYTAGLSLAMRAVAIVHAIIILSGLSDIPGCFSCRVVDRICHRRATPVIPISPIPARPAG
jgi:hypothetical protein